MGLFSRDFHTFNASAGNCWLPARRSTAEAIFVLKLYVYVYIRDICLHCTKLGYSYPVEGKNSLSG